MTSPELSVVVPTHNRRELVRRCVAALLSQTLTPQSFELVVVDDGSSDGTAEMLASLETPFRLTVLQPGPVGQSAARNAGIEAAQGEVCVLLDDDVIPSPEHLAEHLAAHRGAGRRIGIGSLSQVAPSGGDWYARAFARGWAAHYQRLERKQASWADCYGGNISAPRAALLKVGGFATDVEVSKDIELGFRLCEAGCTPTYLPRAHAVHDDQKPRTRLLHDVWLHGAGYVELSHRHPAMFPKLLGWFGAATRRELALRRALIALRVPPSALAAAGRLIPGEGRQDAWYEFVWKLAFWRSVRASVSRARWAELTSTTAGTGAAPADEATS